MEVRFAGDDVALGSLMEEELIRAAQLEMLEAFVRGRERERLREIMRFRRDKAMGMPPGALMGEAWTSGAEGVEVPAPGYAMV
jgi:hypothetical protein